MPKAQLQTVTETYLVCPQCSKNSGQSITHLLKGKKISFGPWSCNECGRYFRGEVEADNSVQIECDDSRNKTSLLVLLKLPPQDKTVYVVTKGMAFSEQGKPIDLDKSYYYNQHTCPTNWTRNIQLLSFDSDTDPHGLFEFVRSVPIPENYTDPDYHDKANMLVKLFPEMMSPEEESDNE